MKNSFAFLFVLFAFNSLAQKGKIPSIRVGYPDTLSSILCMTYDEAKRTLDKTSHTFKYILPKKAKKISNKYWVYKQSPTPYSVVYKSTEIVLFFSNIIPSDCDE